MLRGALSSFQQDRQRLAIRILRPRLDLRELQAADRMIDHHERVIRQAHHARDISRSDFEGVGAQHHGAFAALFEGNAVMQTAR